MDKYKVGASILNTITESLYDNPIVVFREYVQNSVDSLSNKRDDDKYEIHICVDEKNIYFVDNGDGIKADDFSSVMTSIANSGKERKVNLGYKGIGRLSGISYCDKLIFINIVDYSKKILQVFEIDGNKYRDLKDEKSYGSLTFEELMIKIGESKTVDSAKDYYPKYNFLDTWSDLFSINNKGFVVILKEISSVIKNIITKENFSTELKWLLPVDFDDSLYSSEYKDLFMELSKEEINGYIPSKSYNIFYEGKQLFRPITVDNLRTYVCKTDFKYAVAFHSFSNNKFVITKDNPFSGIRIYIDNMLLCTENELIQNLENYGLLNHTSNSQFQSIKSIGAMIYITDKVNISANARRTFIEMTDTDSLDFLKILNEYLDKVYDTRYAISDYLNAKENHSAREIDLSERKEKALSSLKALASEEISAPTVNDKDYDKLDLIDKKKTLKKNIQKELNSHLKEYLKQIDNYDLTNAYRNFYDWLIKQNNK